LQSYLFFWDKLNKANYYLELSIQEADRSLDDRLITHLAGDLISDGGQWDMVVNLLEVLNHPIRIDGTNNGFGRTMVWFRNPFILNLPIRLYPGP
jgi:Peptidase C1-like family